MADRKPWQGVGVFILGLSAAGGTAQAACTDLMTTNFIGKVCDAGTIVETHEGQWILDDGGTFIGDIELRNTGGVRRVVKSGRLFTPTFQGTLSSTADSYVITTGPIHKLYEVRNGTESLPDGSVFIGEQTLDITDNAATGTQGTGVPLTTTTLHKEGNFSSDIHSVQLTVDTDHSMQESTVLQDSRITTMQGKWVYSPTQKLQGTLTVSVVNGVRTVQDNRTRAQ
jgi:hypothetical protein